MKNSKPRLTGLLATVMLGLALTTGDARAEERMNGMVGLFYSSYNTIGFEYDLIAQFQKSKEWMGNISGFYVSDEIYQHANRLGLGFVLGQRADEKGTFAANIDGFGETRFSRFSTVDWGAEAKITLAIFGLKVGVINTKTLFVEAGFSY